MGDEQRVYKAATSEVGDQDLRQIGRWANNRAETSHLPVRRRERAMHRFRRMKTLQKFASIHNHVNQARHLISREHDK